MARSAHALSIDADADLEASAWLAGGGEMGARMRAKDWSATPLSSADSWPQSVKTAVSICLNSRFPIVLWLGPERGMHKQHTDSGKRQSEIVARRADQSECAEPAGVQLCLGLESE